MMQPSEGVASILGEDTPRDMIMNAEQPALGTIQPGLTHNQTIGNLHIEHSHNIRIGPDITTDRVIILNTPTNENTTNSLFNLLHGHDPDLNNSNEGSEENDRERHLVNVAVKTQFVLCMAYGVAILVLIVLVLVWKYENPDEKSGNSTTVPTSEPPTTVVPPKDWFVNVTQWSSVKNPINSSYMIKEKRVLAIDDTDKESCSTESACIKYLEDMQKHLPKINNNINYNYLIGGDGRVYEARGNDYPPDDIQAYSDSIMKVAFIGMYRRNITLSTLQKDGLDTLIHYLILNKYIVDGYRIMPQCCRNIPGESGPAPKIIEYLHQHYAMHWTKDNKCPCVNNINTRTEVPWW